MDWRSRVELFEEIRREYEFGIGTIAGVAKKLRVHRRMVREAIGSAMPAPRKKTERPRWKLAGAVAFVDEILELDRKAPRKQLHAPDNVARSNVSPQRGLRFTSLSRVAGHQERYSPGPISIRQPIALMPESIGKRQNTSFTCTHILRMPLSVKSLFRKRSGGVFRTSRSGTFTN